MGAEPREVPRDDPRESRFGRFLDRVAPGVSARRRTAELQLRRVKMADRVFTALEREARAVEFKRGAYQGATTNRGYTSWVPGAGSADEDILDDLDQLRQRHRDLIRNDPHAAGIAEEWVENIVGNGLRPQSRVNAKDLGWTEDQVRAYQRSAEAAFSRFWRVADYSEQLTFGEIQGLAIRGIFESGDSFVIPRPDPAASPSLRLQLLEADRIMTPMKEQADIYIRDGVRIDRRGRHLGVYVKGTHPGDELGRRTFDDFAFVPTRDAASGLQNVFHLYRPKRPEQSRGVPLLAPATLIFRDLSQYFRAELFAAKVAACFALFITTPDPHGMALNSAGGKTTGGQLVEQLEPGMIKHLGIGETVTAANPSRPNSGFDGFAMRNLRMIGAPINMPYESVSKDFSQTTYTSGRMALNEIRRVYTSWKCWLTEKFCQPVWERVLEEAFLRGELVMPAGMDFYELREAICAARWVGPGWTWVDPQKEVDATITAMANHLTTLADECAARGLDWEEILEQRAREKAKEKELGLEVPAPAGAGAPAAAAQDGGNADGNYGGGKDAKPKD